MKALVGMVVLSMISTVALAQQRPDGPGPGAGPGLEAPGRGPEHDGPGRDVGGPSHISQFDVFRGYMELVERYSRISSNGGQAGVAAVVTAAEVLRPKGADAAIAYFTKALDKTKNLAVQRAIRLQLVELYRSSGNADKALEQLDVLITGAPEGETPGPSQPPPGH